MTNTWYCWTPVVNHVIPDHAVIGGHEGNGKPLYITRTMVDGKLVPGKFGNHLGCHYSLNGEEKPAEIYDVLVLDPKYPGEMKWLESNDGAVGPCEKNAIKVEDGVYTLP